MKIKVKSKKSPFIYVWAVKSKYTELLKTNFCEYSFISKANNNMLLYYVVTFYCFQLDNFGEKRISLNSSGSLFPFFHSNGTLNKYISMIALFFTTNCNK